jgi:hypothetical protein
VTSPRSTRRSSAHSRPYSSRCSAVNGTAGCDHNARIAAFSSAADRNGGGEEGMAIRVVLPSDSGL